MVWENDVRKERYGKSDILLLSYHSAFANNLGKMMNDGLHKSNDGLHELEEKKHAAEKQMNLEGILIEPNGILSNWSI